MPVSFWKIKSYTVLLHESKPPDPGVRVLELFGDPRSYRAVMNFREGYLQSGTVYVFDPPNPLGVKEHIRSSWPAHRFAETYDVLRSEAPVYLAYSWAPPDDKPKAPYGTILQIGITSADKPWWEDG